MSNTFLYIAWGAMYAICAGLGFIAAPEGAALWLMVIFSLLFFLPPAILLYRAVREDHKPTLRRIRNISLIWLIAATCAICLNILSVLSSELTGRVLYYILILVSAPMVCGQYWVISLFLWACLLIVSWNYLRKK